MSARANRKLKRERKFLKLGREAASAIAAVQNDLEAARDAERLALEHAQRTEVSARQQVTAKATALETALASATSSREVIDLLRGRIADLERDQRKAVADAVEQTSVKWADTVELKRRAHLAEVNELQAQHDAVRLGLEEQVRVSEARAAHFKAEWEEPDKLRRRLATKQAEIEALQTEICRVRDAKAAEVRVSFGR